MEVISWKHQENDAGLATLIWEKLVFRIRNIAKDKGGHYKNIK